MKFWQGQFNEGLDATVEQFVSTFAFDKRLYKHDIMGSLAHCTMLGEQGIITEEETKVIQKALTGLFNDITKGKVTFENSMNVFEFIDREIEERVGEVGKKLDIARGDVDRASLSIRMYVIELCSDINETLKTLVETIMEIASGYTLTMMPGEFHGMKAQPTSLGHSLLALSEGFVRDIERFIEVKKHANVMPLYSAYGTGVRYPINRRRVAQMLGFSSVTQNSLDALTDMDFISEFMSACSITAKHISKVCNAYIKWCSKDYGYAIPDGSINIDSKVIPQTDLPIVLEALNYKANKCVMLGTANATAVVPTLSYNRAVYESIETVFEAESLIKNSANILTAILPSFAFDDQAMLKAANAGYITALDCVDYLVLKGMSKDEAYEIAGKLCEYCAENNKRLDTLTMDVYESFSPLFERDIVSSMKVRTAVRQRKHEGEPSDVTVRAEIRSLQRRLKRLFRVQLRVLR